MADYRSVDPRYGTMADFEQLIEEVHNRGMRITIDLVMNHTSDQHPWFQASRHDRNGPYGDYYVWSDTNDKWTDARVIFTDVETTNWAWDPVREQYFWHRFYSHQPDLNFENPAVREEMLDIASFWLAKGIDGFRLDAVPYLFEDDGNAGENDPRTHAFLRELRALVDREAPGAVLLAEANQPPHQAAAYFGTDEEPECHMCFHFPVMPRIFYSIKAEDATHLRAVLHDTPVPPASGQWSTFLRNHAGAIWAGDFLPVTDALFRPVYAFFVIALGTRRVVHVGVTRHPTDAWVAQQLREATPFDQRPRYLIRDNDSKYGRAFARVAEASEMLARPAPSDRPI